MNFYMSIACDKLDVIHIDARKNALKKLWR